MNWEPKEHAHQVTSDEIAEARKWGREATSTDECPFDGTNGHSAALAELWQYARNTREMREGESIRLGVCRIAFRPDWDTTLPYITYYRGSAGQHFASLIAAKTHLGLRLADWSAPT